MLTREVRSGVVERHSCGRAAWTQSPHEREGDGDRPPGALGSITCTRWGSQLGQRLPELRAAWAGARAWGGVLWAIYQAEWQTSEERTLGAQQE